MIAILIGLTACGDEDKDNKKSADEKIIDKYEEAMDSQDIDKLYDLIVYDEDVYDELELSRISKSDMKNVLDEISSYKINSYTRIRTKSDIEDTIEDDITDEDWDKFEDIIEDKNKIYYLDALLDDEEENDILIINSKNKIIFARINFFF